MGTNFKSEKEKVGIFPLPFKELNDLVSLTDKSSLRDTRIFSHWQSFNMYKAFESFAKFFTTFKTVAFVFLLLFNTENIPLH